MEAPTSPPEAHLSLPQARGPLSRHVLDVLRSLPAGSAMRSVPADGADDEQLTLFVLQQISYRRFDGVDPAWEEHPDLVAVRNGLEAQMERRLRFDVTIPDVAPAGVPDALAQMLAEA